MLAVAMERRRESAGEGLSRGEREKDEKKSEKGKVESHVFGTWEC